MKNRIVLAALAALTLFSGTALAESCLGQKDVRWRFINSSGIANQTVATKSLAASGTDTTTWVSTADFYVPQAALTATDSIAIGQFVVSIDSSAAYAPAQTSISAVVEGHWGGVPNDVNVINMTTFSMNPTTGEKTMVFPVYITGIRTAMNKNQLQRVPSWVRMRFQSSAVINAGRISFQYLKPCFEQVPRP
jgi:hypothetical protein